MLYTLGYLYLVLMIFLVCVLFIIIFYLVRAVYIRQGRYQPKMGKIFLRSYFVLVLIFTCLAIFFRNNRTPSAQRLICISGIQLPKEFHVIKDDFQNNWQDYSLDYVIQLDKSQMMEVIGSIPLHSAGWKDAPTGYRFEKSNERDGASIDLDTLNMTLTFKQSHD